MKKSFGESFFQALNVIIMSVVSLVMLLPVWHVLMHSLSRSDLSLTGGLFLWPRGFSLHAYKVVLRDALIGGAYVNTVIVTVLGTLLNLTMTFLAAYPLSNRNLRWRRPIQYMIFFTMLFNGGIIPTYLLVRSLGLLDSLLSLVIPVSVSAYNIFVMRNFIETLPDSLAESARIDGASEWTILFRIIVPLSKPAMAVLGLMYAVGHWNSWFNCIIYIKSTARYTLQPIIRQILFTLGSSNFYGYDPDMGAAAMPKLVTMAVVVVATLPIIMVYPFLQRFFIKGVMLGAVKG